MSYEDVEIMSKCPQCGSTNLKVVSRLGTLETWQCENCGHEMFVHVSDPSIGSDVPLPSEPIFQLMGSWVTRPDAQKLSELRSLSLRLRTVPDSTLIRNAINGTKFEIGRFNDSEMSALDLEAKLLALGLELERVPVQRKGPPQQPLGV